jgi:hypothetical protein
MASPCRQCLDSESECFRSADSTRCGNYVLKGYPYDGSGPSARDFDKIRREHDRLQNKMAVTETAEKQAFKAQEQVFEAQRVARAKRKRLEHLQSFLKKRGGELIRRGLDSVEELERLEALEKTEAELAAVTAVTASSDSFSLGEFDAFLAQEHPDLFGKNLQPTAGRS